MSKYYDSKQLSKEPINIIYGSTMTKEEKNKYAYELMVKNNPDEAVKNLMLLDNIIQENIVVRDRLSKAIEYIEEYQEVLKEHNGDWLNYQDGFKPYLLNILRGESNDI